MVDPQLLRESLSALASEERRGGGGGRGGGGRVDRPTHLVPIRDGKQLREGGWEGGRGWLCVCTTERDNVNVRFTSEMCCRCCLLLLKVYLSIYVNIKISATSSPSPPPSPTSPPLPSPPLPSPPSPSPPLPSPPLPPPSPLLPPSLPPPSPPSLPPDSDDDGHTTTKKTKKQRSQAAAARREQTLRFATPEASIEYGLTLNRASLAIKSVRVFSHDDSPCHSRQVSRILISAYFLHQRVR